MKSNRVCLAAVAAILGGSSFALTAEPQPTFSLSFSAPANVVQVAGSTASYEAIGKLTTSGLTDTDQGAQAWSLSMSSEGGSIVNVTVAGTAADDVANGGLYDGGFKRNELTVGAGNEGAISAIVLSLTNPAALPATGSADIVKVTVAAMVPDPVVDAAGDPSCVPLLSRLFFIDGRKGGGQPVDNRVTWKGATFLPTTADATSTICPIVVKPLVLRVDVDGAKAGEKSGDLTPWNINVPAGTAMVPVRADVVLQSNIPGSGGAQGWSISLATEPCFTIGAVTTSGTAVDRLFSGGFKKTEIADPARNAGKHGAVSAVVLSFTDPIRLPEVGEEVVLKISGQLDASGITAAGDTTAPCTVRIGNTEAEYLRGSGQPVKTAVTVQGLTRTPGVCNAAIQLTGAREGRFVRGNANNDSKDDIADAVWIVNEIFRSGLSTRCRDAADANNDGQIDLSDALYIIGYQFQLQAAPPAPFPDCGTDPEGDSDGLLCEETQVRC